MRVGLFIPCFVDDFYPEAAEATLEVLERVGCEVVYPPNQTCCGQPFFNNGLAEDARPLARRFARMFEPFDYVVSPGSSCVSVVRHRYGEVLDARRAASLAPRVYELCEFLHDVIGLDALRFPAPATPLRVGLHNSCHGLRELHLARPSELNVPHFSKIRAVLARVPQLEIVEPSRDECCGFGGTYSIGEPEISAMAGRDRIADHRAAGVEIMTGVDMSCLMHMQGLARRDATPMRFVHVAQLLAGRV